MESRVGEPESHGVTGHGPQSHGPRGRRAAGPQGRRAGGPQGRGQCCWAGAAPMAARRGEPGSRGVRGSARALTLT